MTAPAPAGVTVRDLGCRDLSAVWADMRALTERRADDSPDEIWFVEHPAVFTLGLNGDPSHIHDAGAIPIVKIDRGGQVTYHGPGQSVAYVMLDLRRRSLGIRGLVEALECAVIDTVAGYGVEAYARRDAPGVYVESRKLAAVGLRIRRHCTYHGVAVNVAMDLEPFRAIDPCGYAGLEVTQLKDLCDVADVSRFRRDFEPHLRARLFG